MPEFSSDELIILGFLVAGLIAFLARLISSRDPIQAATDAFNFYVTSSEAARANERRFLRLPEDARQTIQQLIDVADPLTPFVPGDLDQRAVTYLRNITDGKPETGALSVPAADVLDPDAVLGAIQAMPPEARGEVGKYIAALDEKEADS